MIFKVFGKILPIVLFLLSLSLSGQTKRALVIGLGSQKDKNWAPIHGDRDAVLMKSLLRECHFEEIQVLINEKATKKAIVNAFKRLAKESRTGDIVYVHFSGHGQLMSDLDGDEEDGWDECWIPYDAYMSYGPEDDGKFHLTDDEVNRLLMDISRKIGQQGKILVVVDACHSGDSTRGEEDEIFRGVSSKFLLPHDNPITFIRGNKEKWLTFSACKDYQRNAEVKTSDGYYGKLTLALFYLLRKKERLPNELLYNRIMMFFDKNRGSLPQTPVLSGETSGFLITELFK